jgi:CheY-like chemotaxis protein
MIGPLARRGSSASRKETQRGSGIFGRSVSRVVLFIAAGDDVLRTYQSLASASGLGAELARDAHEAVLLAQLARPDIVVLDLSDGRLDGRWILARLRASMSTRTRPMVFVGSRPPESPDNAGGAPAYTVQADDPFEVLRVVELALEVRHAPEATG